MVLGRTHSLHGLAAGLLASQLAPAVSIPMTIPTALTLGMLGAGAAIAPDLDCKGATASRSLGPLSWAASAGIRAISAAVYEHTKTRYDRPNEDGHRGITHTGPGALGLGLLFGGGCAIANAVGPIAGLATTLGVLWIFLVWALRALPPKQRYGQDYLAAAVLTGLAWYTLQREYPAGLPLLIGVTIAFGAYVHACGDALTDYGAPLAFPLRIRGQRWYSCGSPRPLRFKAGKTVERVLIFPASLFGAGAALIGVIPGAWPHIAHAVAIAF